jgi:hypothetical protein
MTLDFEDWTDGELLSLFCAGITTELIQEHKLSTTAMLAFPVLSVDGFTMYEELLATGYYPEKKEWKKYPLLDASPELWDARKLKVMTYITLDKYRRHTHLRDRLLATDQRYIEETNHWNDSFYGVDIRIGGRNELGKLLMNVRQFFRVRPL